MPERAARHEGRLYSMGKLVTVRSEMKGQSKAISNEETMFLTN